ncbi:MAG: CapA family protein, partial [Parabacteroides sp.]|nr:CapA family protein [Parabacteroides sp.]
MLQINFFGDFACTNVSKLSLSEDLKNILLNSDYNCLNFEAPLRSYEEQKIIKKSGPRLSMPDEVLNFISENNFNITSLANNHIMDYGESGLRKTMSLLQDRAVGVGTYEEAYTPKIISKGRITVAFLSLTHREFGCVDVNSDRLGAAWILNPELPIIISKIKCSVDFLFVLAHAGVEYMDIPLPEWRSTYKLFIDWGADCIIASHPHVPQGFEIYKNKYIYYSLGNFCFQKEAIKFECNNKPYWNNSLMVSVKISE